MPTFSEMPTEEQLFDVWDRLTGKRTEPRKHMGPGDHPGTGTPQSIHGSGGGGGSSGSGDGGGSSGSGQTVQAERVTGDKPSGLGKEILLAATETTGFKPVNPEGVDSFEMFTDADGNFTPERTAMHDKIIADILANAPKQENPEYRFMGGGPGSGKTSVLRSGQVKLPEDNATIAGDDIKLLLPEYEQMAGQTEHAAELVHRESSHIAKRATAEALAKGCNIVIDGTGDSGIAKLRGRVEKARKAGYKVTGTYVTIEIEDAVARARERRMKTKRGIPESAIRAIHKDVTTTFEAAMKEKLFDRATLWDNGGKPGQQFLVAEFRDNDLKVHNADAWTRFLAKDD